MFQVLRGANARATKAKSSGLLWCVYQKRHAWPTSTGCIATLTKRLQWTTVRSWRLGKFNHVLRKIVSKCPGVSSYYTWWLVFSIPLAESGSNRHRRASAPDGCILPLALHQAQAQGCNFHRIHGQGWRDVVERVFRQHLDKNTNSGRLGL